MELGFHGDDVKVDLNDQLTGYSGALKFNVNNTASVFFKQMFSEGQCEFKYVRENESAFVLPWKIFDGQIQRWLGKRNHVARNAFHNRQQPGRKTRTTTALFLQSFLQVDLLNFSWLVVDQWLSFPNFREQNMNLD